MGDNKTTGDFHLAPEILQASQVLGKEFGLVSEIALRNTKGAVLSGDKLERKEMVYGPLKLVLDAGYAVGYFDNTDKDLVVKADASNLEVGSVLTFQDKDKKSKGSLTVMVTVLVDDTTVKVQKIGGKDIVLATDDFAYMSGSALEEGSKNSGYKGIKRPRNVYNYSRIFRVAGEISRTMAETNNYDFANIKQELVKQVIYNFTNELNSIATSEIRADVAGKKFYKQLNLQ